MTSQRCRRCRCRRPGRCRWSRDCCTPRQGAGRTAQGKRRGCDSSRDVSSRSSWHSSWVLCMPSAGTAQNVSRAMSQCLGGSFGQAVAHVLLENKAEIGLGVAAASRLHPQLATKRLQLPCTRNPRQRHAIQHRQGQDAPSLGEIRSLPARPEHRATCDPLDSAARRHRAGRGRCRRRAVGAKTR